MSETWPESRADAIGQNGNEGLHYDSEPQPDRSCMDCGVAEGRLHHHNCASLERNNGPLSWASLRPLALQTFTRSSAQDPAAHYRHTLRAAITDDDIARGYTEVKLDPYRVADVYGLKGGPREQILKKCLRWTDKGQTEDQVIGEIESALKRWKQMREEDRRVPL